MTTIYVEPVENKEKVTAKDHSNTRKRNNTSDKPKTQRKYNKSSTKDDHLSATINTKHNSKKQMGGGSAGGSAPLRRTQGGDCGSAGGSAGGSAPLRRTHGGDSGSAGGSVPLRRTQSGDDRDVSADRPLIRSTNPFLGLQQTCEKEQPRQSKKRGNDNNIFMNCKHGKETDNHTNIFMQQSSSSSSPSLSSASHSIDTRHNNQRKFEQSSGSGSGSNYFIHNSKIQMSRLQNNEELSTTITNKSPECILDIQDKEQFPSLCGKTTTIQQPSQQISSGQNVWGKKLKVTPVEVAKEVEVAVKAEAEVKAEVKAEVPCNPGVYKAKTVSSLPTNVLSKDNIFLGAFVKIPSETPISCGDVVECNDEQYSSHTPLSVLVDSCDSTYDRFYK